MDVYCLGCKKKTIFDGDVERKVHQTSKGVKYSLVGRCPDGHKVSKIVKKDEVV